MSAPPLLSRPVVDPDDSLPAKLFTDGPILDRLAWLEQEMGKDFLIGHCSLIAEAADLIHEQAKLIADFGALVVKYEGTALLSLKPAAMPTGPLLPGEAPSDPEPLPWKENPPPDSRSPLEVVISQPQAVRALVRHYGWRHCGAKTLFRPDWPGGHVVTSPATTPVDDSVIDLVEAPGSIADHAAAAAASVA